MLQKVKIKQVWRGTQLVRKGTPDEKEVDKVSIKTEQHGDNWLTTLKTRGTEDLAEGQEVELSIEQKGQYYNFSMPSDLEKRVAVLEDIVLPKTGSTTAGPVMAPEEINPDEIPL